MRREIAVAIPVKDEVARIGRCLTGLARQSIRADHIVLLLNNCTDGTAAAVQAAPMAANRLHIVECSLPGALASAGIARGMAMDHAAALLDDGVLLTTDADAEVAENWIEANMAAIKAGADAVCGMAAIDPLEALLIPRHLHEDDAREVAFGRLLDEIGSIIIPDPADPWPRHAEDSGASLAITAAMFRHVGGMPDAPSGEDRALIGKLRMIGAKVRHDPDIIVIVSGRIEGRAPGGMADTIRRRIVQQDEFTDDRIEPAVAAIRRARLKRRFRDLRGRADAAAFHRLAKLLAIAPDMLAEATDAPYSGLGWAMIEQASPALARQRVRFADIPREMAIARRFHRRLIGQTDDRASRALALPPALNR